MPNRILIVDDDALARELYRDALVLMGHEVLVAATAKDAADVLDREAVDVVVTDLILPGADGLAVIDDVKRRDPGIEVVVITGVDRVGPAVRAIKSGASDYLVKPVTPEALELAISRSLATRQLLQENQVLRGHLALVETGQRLATTLERDELFPQAVAAFARTLSAPSALLFARRSDGTYMYAANHGLSEDTSKALSAAALPLLEGLDKAATEVTVGSETFRVLVAEEAGEIHGMCLLRQPSREHLRWTNAYFLARHYALAMKNIKRLKAVEDLAYLDDLTRLYNVRFLDMVLDREINASRQTGAPFSVLFLDLDHFKSINDTYGHLVGSKVIVEMGQLLKDCVRDIDVVVRYGGDEYVVILLKTDAGGALKVGERIRRTIESRRFQSREGLNLTLTACIGLASYPEHARDKTHILECADRAMYRGKQGTRNVIYVATPSGDGAVIPQVKTA